MKEVPFALPSALRAVAAFWCVTVGLAALLPAQAVSFVIVDVRSNDPVVKACQKLQDALTAQLTTVTRNQDTQISRATALNRSIGDWGNAGPGSVPPVEAAALTLEHTSALRTGATFDSRTAKAITGLQTASGQALNLDAADFADFTLFDQTGQRTQSALETLAAEIKATNQEVAETYAQMIKSGADQQTYEKLRGKMQALHLHLQGLQAQQRAAFGLLQAQARALDHKRARDAEIAAQVQKQNHVEHTRALGQLQFQTLEWR